MILYTVNRDLIISEREVFKIGRKLIQEDKLSHPRVKNQSEFSSMKKACEGVIGRSELWLRMAKNDFDEKARLLSTMQHNVDTAEALIKDNKTK
jgi:hypothetical protein